MLTPRKMQYDKAGPKVAEALNISSHTVYFHLRNLTKKRDSEEVV